MYYSIFSSNSFVEIGSALMQIAANSDIKNYPAPYEIGILRRFDFTSKLQRMSVIVNRLDENL